MKFPSFFLVLLLALSIRTTAQTGEQAGPQTPTYAISNMHQMTVGKVAYSADGERFAFMNGNRDQELLLWDLETIMRKATHAGYVHYGRSSLAVVSPRRFRPYRRIATGFARTENFPRFLR